MKIKSCSWKTINCNKIKDPFTYINASFVKWKMTNSCNLLKAADVQRNKFLFMERLMEGLQSGRNIQVKHIKLTSPFYTAVISLYKNDNKHCRQARSSKDIWNITVSFSSKSKLFGIFGTIILIQSGFWEMIFYYTPADFPWLNYKQISAICSCAGSMIKKIQNFIIR